MPYSLEKVPGGYYVVSKRKHTDSEGQFGHIAKIHEHSMQSHHTLPHHRHSHHPLSHEMAVRQMRALMLHAPL